MRVLAILLACLTAGAATAGTADIDRVAVYAAGGKSITSWHGQADLSALNFELEHDISPRTELAFVIAPMNLWQPRSWFGDQFGDGSESVRAISGSLLLRRKFRTESARAVLYLEGGTGPMWAEKRVPAATSRFNFVTQAGAGVILRPQSRLPLVLGYRFMHVSNGGYSPRNPGLNVSALVLGVRFAR